MNTEVFVNPLGDIVMVALGTQTWYITVLIHFLPGTVGDFDKVGRENGAKYCPDGVTHNGTYNSVILDKIERSRAVRSYDDVTREGVKTPLGKNILIIS